jgi:hypothetical protein
VLKLTTKPHKGVGRSEEIVAAFIPYKKGWGPTILHSHGNAVDLGQMLPFYKWVAPPAAHERSCCVL